MDYCASFSGPHLRRDCGRDRLTARHGQEQVVSGARDDATAIRREGNHRRLMGPMSKEVCNSSVIAAYIDGELEEGPRILFEEHVEGCSPCRAELQAHRLFMCELDAVMAQRMDLEVPANFSSVVAARAESDMSGVRSFAERRKALSFCLILALLAFALLSTSARDSIFHFFGKLTG